MEPGQGVLGAGGGDCLPLLHEVDGVSMSPGKPLVLTLLHTSYIRENCENTDATEPISHCLIPFQLPPALFTALEPYGERISCFQAILLLVCGSLKERGLCRVFEGPAGDSPTFPFPQLLGSSLL